jgi:hypothetical protein
VDLCTRMIHAFGFYDADGGMVAVAGEMPAPRESWLHRFILRLRDSRRGGIDNNPQSANTTPESRKRKLASPDSSEGSKSRKSHELLDAAAATGRASDSDSSDNEMAVDGASSSASSRTPPTHSRRGSTGSWVSPEPAHMLSSSSPEPALMSVSADPIAVTIISGIQQDATPTMMMAIENTTAAINGVAEHKNFIMMLSRQSKFMSRCADMLQEYLQCA